MKHLKKFENIEPKEDLRKEIRKILLFELELEEVPYSNGEWRIYQESLDKAVDDIMKLINND